jgi:hypothetical protein
MQVELKPIEQVMNPELIPRFPFLDRSSSHFRLLRMQCQGDLIADAEQGVRVEDDTHRDICKSTLSKARDNGVDILLTPEYSIPWDLVEEMIQNPELQPQAGALWCLCCQGIPWGVFIDFMRSLQSHHVVQPSIAKEQNFVNVLLYVFQSTEVGKLVIIPQLKLQHMRDETLSHEAAGLTEGDVIYKFGHDLSNQLCSIICADAYHNDIKQNLRKFDERGNEHWIILHPQLNPKPRDGIMTDFRRNLFDIMGSRKAVYITANWAEGTVIKLLDGGKVSIRTPWSCIYLRNSDGNWLEGQRIIRNLNLVKGLGFSYLQKKKTIIWHSVKSEHLQQLLVQKPLPGSPAVTISNNGVRAEKVYVRDENHPSWVDSDITFDHCLPSVLAEICKGHFEFPVNASIELRDQFFGLCLGHQEEAQLLADESTEQSRRIGLHIDCDCEELRQSDVDRVAKLTYYLQQPKDGLPGQLGHLEGKYKYNYDNSLKYFNLYPLSGDGRQAVWVAYEERESKARELADKLKKIVEVDREHRVCVFTQTTSLQVKAYPDDYQPNDYYPKYDENITAMKRTKGIVEFDRKGDTDR